MALKKKTLGNIVGKGEYASNQHFLFFPQCFLSTPKRISGFKLYTYFLVCKIYAFNLDQSKNFPFSSSLKLLSTYSFSLEESKICHFERANPFQMTKF